MGAVWIAGAGTDIGKTYVAAALLRALAGEGVAVDALKPVASGLDERNLAPSDPGVLLAALGRPIDAAGVALLAPFRFAAPQSPPLAARMEGRRLDFAEVLELCLARAEAARDALLLIETAGGVMSPLDDTHTMLDLMAALPAPVVLVGGTYLGAISHTLSGLAVLRARGLPVAALAVSESPGDAPPFGETVDAVRAFAGGLPVVGFRRDGDARAAAADLAARARIVLT